MYCYYICFTKVQQCFIHLYMTNSFIHCSTSVVINGLHTILPLLPTRYNYWYRSGLKVGHCGSLMLTHLTHWPIKQSGCDHIWPTCDLYVKVFFLKVANEKFLIWNNATDFFILGRIQNQSLAQTSWRWKLWTLATVRSYLL